MMEWNIQSRSHACQACQAHFSDKENFHTLLFDRRHAYERLDICEKCWQSQYSQGATERKGFISHWQSVYSPPPAAPPEPIQKDTAESLLRKLAAENAPEHAAARFILAVMLERKRILKVKGQVTQEKQRIYLYEHPRSGDLFQIPDPELQLDQLQDVQRDVAQLLEHGLPGASAAPSSPVPSEAAPVQAAESPADPVPAESAK